VLANGASAETLFDTFQAVCVKTVAAPPAALGAAQAAGWAQLPPDLAARVAKGIPGVEGALDGRINSADKRFMVAGDAAFPVGGTALKVHVCVVAGAPAEGETVKPEMASYAAVPQASGTKPGEEVAMFAFAEDAGRHTRIDNPEDDVAVRSLIENGRMRVSFVAEQPGLAMLGLAVPVK
jgi:hypothetical protein